MSLPPGVYDAKVDSIRMPRRGDRMVLDIRVEPSGERLIETMRFEHPSPNTRYYRRYRRASLQQHREWLQHWIPRHVTHTRRVNARAFLSFFLFFPEEGESRVLLDARFEHATEICSSCGEGMPALECPRSERACGHHCNHSWSHEICCYCGQTFEEDV